MFRQTNKPRIDIKEYLKDIRLSQSAITNRTHSSSQQSPSRSSAKHYSQPPQHFSQGCLGKDRREERTNSFSPEEKEFVRSISNQPKTQIYNDPGHSQGRNLLAGPFNTQTTQNPQPQSTPQYVPDQRFPPNCLPSLGNNQVGYPYYPFYQYGQPGQVMQPFNPQFQNQHNQMQYPFFMHAYPPTLGSCSVDKTVPRNKREQKGVMLGIPNKMATQSEQQLDRDPDPDPEQEVRRLLTPLVEAAKTVQKAVQGESDQMRERFSDLAQDSKQDNAVMDGVKSLKLALVPLVRVLSLEQQFSGQELQIVDGLTELNRRVLELVRVRTHATIL